MEYWINGERKGRKLRISETAGAGMTLRPVLSDEEMEAVQKSAGILRDVLNKLKIEK